MSNPIPRATIEDALQKKGFRLGARGRDHRYYYFYRGNKKTIAKTRISTGSGHKEYDDNLFRPMVRELRLENIRQVRDLLKCPMTEEQYIEILRRNDCI